MKIVFTFLVAAVALGVAGLSYIRYRVETGPLQGQFTLGKSGPIPDGFYKGSSPSVNVGNWKGKRFDAKAMSGANVFTGPDGKDLERYPFTLKVVKGVRDTAMEVIKIDYNHPDNPWYLRWFGYDEMVRLEDGRYLGKIQLALLGRAFTIGWFWQER